MAGEVSMQQETSRYVVGIDLGTTNSAVGYVDTANKPWRIQTEITGHQYGEGHNDTSSE